MIPRSPVHRSRLDALALAFVALLALCSCSSPTPTPSPVPTSTRTPKPTFTALAKATALPTVRVIPPTVVSSTATNAPSPTATSTQQPPTVTPQPAATGTPTAEPTPVAPVPSEPTKAPPQSVASAGAVATKPKGAPLSYEPQFPATRPVAAPASFDDHTNPLSGGHVDDPGLLQRRPILVRYGNDSAARPHSGISLAEIVMEDVMDAWWITRLTAVYLQNEPTQVGPLRSARPVNIEILPAFDGVFVFSGASIGVTQLLAQQTFDLIHEGHEGDLFYRGQDRKPPHNLYTSIPDVRSRLRERGLERSVDLRGLSFSPNVPDGQPASRLDIPYPKTSTVAWTWDASAGVYRRWVQGSAYRELLTGEQIGCENVIVLYAQHWESDVVEDSRGSTSIGIALRGGERVQIFRDGQVIEGTWWREDQRMLLQFIDANGNHVPLKPGNSWIQFVPTTYKVAVSR